MATTRIRLDIKALEDFDESSNIMILADSGAGKTVLAGGAPKLLFIATENGTISAKRQGSKAHVAQIEKWTDLEELLDDLDAQLEEGSCKYKWLCIDSLPEMQVKLREHILETGMTENRKGADPDVLQLQDYSKWYNMFLRFVRRLVRMPINVIYTSTTMRVEAEDDDGAPQDIVLPSIEGKKSEGYKLAMDVCAAMSSVYFLNIEGRGDNRRRVMYTQRRPPFFAKCRYGVLPAKMVLAPNDPTTMARIIDKIENGPVIIESVPEPEDDVELGEELEDDVEETPEPEPEKKPAARSRTARTGRSTPAKKDPEPEPEDDFEDDPELDEKPAPKRRTPATRRPAAKAQEAKTPAKKKPKDEPEEDFDDDLDDLDDDYN